jgi:hypothetical protein
MQSNRKWIAVLFVALFPVSYTAVKRPGEANVKRPRLATRFHTFSAPCSGAGHLSFRRMSREEEPT